VVTPSHLLIAQTAYLGACRAFAHPPAPGEAAVALAAALIPELDSRQSYAGRLLPPLAGWLVDRLVGRRTATRSLLAQALGGWLVRALRRSATSPRRWRAGCHTPPTTPGPVPGPATWAQRPWDELPRARPAMQQNDRTKVVDTTAPPLDSVMSQENLLKALVTLVAFILAMGVLGFCSRTRWRWPRPGWQSAPAFRGWP